jgi:hypothetical protein
VLVVSPDSLFVDDASSQATLFLAAAPPGAIDWRVTAAPDWATIEPASGTTASEIAEIVIALSPNALPAGLNRGRIQFISTGGEDEVELFYSVRARPGLEASTTTVTFAEGTDVQALELSNPGNGTTSWAIEDLPAWIAAAPSSGDLLPGQSATVTLTADRAGLMPGDVDGTFRIRSNAETGDVTVAATLAVPVLTRLAVSVPDTVVDYFEDTVAITLRNAGNQTFQWSAAFDVGWVALDVDAGSLEVGASTQVTVDVDRGGLDSADHPFGVEFAVNGTAAERVDLVVRHYEDPLVVLAHRVVDAEYDRNRDRIVTVSATPNLLHVIDPTTPAATTVDLSLAPRCVSIGPDGTRAAVGHDGVVTLVDLVDGVVVDTYAVTTNAVDVVLAGNGYCYVFPRTDQWESIRCIELATGDETNSGGWSIYAGTVGKLHPSGDYIYGANRGLSPSDFEKYDIRGGTAQVMYDSPYHGDYAFSGDVWIADDGGRLFARSGNVFRSSILQSEDMTYNGNLSGDGLIRWAEHSSAAGVVLAFREANWSGNADPGLHVYGTEFLAERGVVDLPPFFTPDGTGGASLSTTWGRFVFVDAAGERYHALVQAEEGAGVSNDWALFSGDVAELP